MRMVTMRLLGQRHVSDAGLAGQVGVSHDTVNGYVVPAMARGIPRVAGIRSVGRVPGAAARLVHVERLADEERLPGWLPLAGRFDACFEERVRRNSVRPRRRSRFATSVERDELIELAQASRGDGASALPGAGGRPLPRNCCAPTRDRQELAS